VASGKRTRSARGVIVRDWLSYTTASVKTLALGPEREVRRTPAGPRQGRFRRWRRSRPFWGGLLLVLAGAEILLIPLASLLIHGGIKLVIYIGIGGVFGVLIGVLLITAGLLLWISPAHKTFYAMAGLVLGILSFPASNLGGFFLGMLLGIIGGGLAFAWTPDPVSDATTRPLPPVPDEAALERPEDATAWPEDAPAWPEDAPAWPEDREGRHRDGGRLLAGALMPVLLASSLVTGHAAAQRASGPAAPADCILWVFCWPSPTPPAVPVPSPVPSSPAAGDPSASPGSVPSDSDQTNPVPGATDPAGGGDSGSARAGSSASRAKMIARADEGLAASVSSSVITAGSATLDGLAYQGTVRMPVAGGEQTMMVFTLNSMTLSGNVTATVTENGQSTVTQSSSLAFSGGVTLYATKLSGGLLGIPTTLTPGNVLTLLLHLLNTVTPAIPLTMTNVTTDQPLVIAGSLQAANLSITT
jgi:uncharacterized protein DUF6114